MARAGFNKFKQAAFLKAFTATGSVRQSCDAAKVASTYSHYEWLEKDPTYKPRFEAAIDEAIAVLEAEAWERAVERRRLYKFTSKGESILHPLTGEPYYEEVSDSGLLWKLLSSLKEKYHDKSAVKVTGEITHEVAEDLKKALAAVHEDEEYAEFRRQRAIGHGKVAGADGERSQPGPLEDDAAPSGD